MFLAPLAARGLSFVARPAISFAERSVAPLATSVAREVTREAGMAAAQVVGQQAVDQISSTINSTTSGPLGQAVGAVVSTAAQGHLALMSGDIVGMVQGSAQQIQNNLHLAQVVTSGLLTGGGGGNVTGADQQQGPIGQLAGPIGTHADTVAASTASQQQELAIAAVAPNLYVRAVSPTPLPVNTSHDTVPALQAHTPMDPVGPAVTQGAPQPIMQVAAAYQAREVEPQRVYNQDHSAMLPPVTLLQTDQSQLRVTSDPLPPPPPEQSSSSSTPIIVVGTVVVGGVLIFLWYRQRRV